MGRTCDVAIIGAGPAGATAAALLARRGLDVTLIDRAAFPRPKVCGGCLSGRGVALLRQAGLGHVLDAAVPLHGFTLWSHGRCAHLPLEGGVSISRSALDHALVRAAVRQGARLLERCSAVVGPVVGRRRMVQLRQSDENEPVLATLVLAADGLGGSCLAQLPGFAPTVRGRSHVGLGANLGPVPSLPLPRGRIVMACGRRGYAGLVRLEDGSVNVACALPPEAIRAAGSPQAAVQRLVDESGLGLPLPPGSWHGTAELTRRRRLFDRRLLVLGDAAGYVEPFTGEGMAWAVQSALTVVPLVLQILQDDSTEHLESHWPALQAANLGRAQRRCRALTTLLRAGPLRRLAVAALARRPQWAAPVLHGLQAPLEPDAACSGSLT